MKKLLISIKTLLLLFQLTSALTAEAQINIQLGSGTLWNNAIPLNSDAFYSYTQAIYTRGEMIAAGATTAGMISKIRYKTVNVTPCGTWDYWTVYMGNTTIDSFVLQTDWRPVNTMNKVFEMSLPLIDVSQANSWVELTLDTPFHWNGTGNIVIAVDENRPMGNVQWQYWQGYTATTAPGYGRGLHYSTDFFNPDPVAPPAGQVISNIPQIQFEFTPDGTLPVTFGPLSAKTTSAGLQVNWQTFSEKNVDHFGVLVSSDGKHFKQIGELASKGVNGNSSAKLDYGFFLSVADLNSRMSFAYIPAVFAISLLLIFVNRGNKRWVLGPLIFVLVISSFSCRKDQQSEALTGLRQLFVKIEQVDKDGTRSSSAIVKAQTD
ncbi:hypothetical protein ACTJIJ_15265 [Niabella sp. 22666]|uniref:hypothetical protein n=1 Tax=Niabella sp. 22666 TaxID=3453954 RepID=UPI003F843ACA